ncbi:SubName: Full=Uncharacterized protein {ECO:0000313/EMBL:CCA67256.1} [Serendipita indica DSM 11827]|uniref:Uncharacterized protein n=1 Tax=Serendipita indica (strain DSM 11827) TaxID=1109443 RepID=G4T7D8_SERID|nr:SubName: Full=Uncharacterized protein {ECO:0000313/EMBL:CCA67256.1} [Serendipita indica DSM 11827]CCA67256.1 hypothetical protein PIIN_01089 [Serendipita indica DSM 11827]
MTSSQVQFCTDVKVLDEWAKLTGLSLPPSGDALSQSYARAHGWLNHLKDQLVQRAQWREQPTGDARMLFAVTCPLRGPSNETLTISLPAYATSFFSPNRTTLFASCFQSALFSNTRHSTAPVADILHLLQCLIPGMLTVVMVENVPGQGTWTTSRGLPPVEWVDANRDQLTAVVGREHYARIRHAAATKTMSFKTSCK